jgi:phosphoglucomutase
MDSIRSYETWLQNPVLSADERRELESISGDKEEIESRFFSRLTFGTAGLRGIMGLGLYRMNRYVVRHATQAFAEVILEDCGDQSVPSVAICYDCRIGSREFAEDAASVMAAGGIGVRLFESPRPTPELSFAIREYGLTAGINITASHNPKEYNGYKVYWADGAQLPPRHADAIARKMEALDVFGSVRMTDYEQAVRDGRITLMGSETDELFLKNVLAQANDLRAVRDVADTFRMVYTPFHGTGYRLVPEALGRLGVKHLLLFAEQMSLTGRSDGQVAESRKSRGFHLAVGLRKKNGADFILGTDPDADRVGIMERDKAATKDDFGPQDGCFAPRIPDRGEKKSRYDAGATRRAQDERDDRDGAARVARKTACLPRHVHGIQVHGGKEKRAGGQRGGQGYLLYEESYGYMLGDYVRDKDAVTASLEQTEMAHGTRGRV